MNCTSLSHLQYVPELYSWDTVLFSSVPDQPACKALRLLRDVLRNEWGYPKRASLSSIESLDADVDSGERPAKRRRVPLKVPCGIKLQTRLP